MKAVTPPEQIDGLSMATSSSHLLALPTELRLQIYDYLVPDLPENREDFDTTSLKDFTKIRAQEHRLCKSYSWIFSHPIIFNEGLEVVFKNYRVVFFNVTDVWPCRRLLDKVKEIKLDLEHARSKQVQRALFTALSLPNLEKLWIYTTWRTLPMVDLKTHTSCSQKLQIGPCFGSMILCDSKIGEKYRRQNHNIQWRQLEQKALEDKIEKARADQARLSTLPIEKAKAEQRRFPSLPLIPRWLFGTSDGDIDRIEEYDATLRISELDILAMELDLMRMRVTFMQHDRAGRNAENGRWIRSMMDVYSPTMQNRSARLRKQQLKIDSDLSVLKSRTGA